MKPKGYDDCEQIKSFYAIYSIPHAALLWCDVPENQIDDHILKSTQTAVRGVLSNPYIPCLEPKCRALHNAIDNGELPVCREKGVPVDEHVAPERRHVRREDLKFWIAKTFPDQKPIFLFDEKERASHPSINSDSFIALQADMNATKIENEKLKQKISAKLEEIRGLELQIESMSRIMSKPQVNELTETERNSMLKIILGMAVHKYRYKIGASRNEATGTNKNSIQHSVEMLGLRINDDTIRKYLVEAENLHYQQIPMND
jgi:hypothetical protein